MLTTAMDSFQVAKRQHGENVKGQYTDKTAANGGAKTFFRASEMGDSDRKMVYGFFGHKLPKIERKAHNLRQLENGNFVHDRYQSAWDEMGILISMEERLSSKKDEYLAQFPWEWAGHYDGLLDLNIIRAHALGLARIESVLNEETGQYELVVDIDDVYGKSIGLFAEDGSIAEGYQPLPMVADIKTMNPYGFKDIKNKRDISKIGGYIDQIMFYMYMLGTPYGSIYIESKDNNDVVEVQILWADFYEGEPLEWNTDLHGAQASNQVRHKVFSDQFFGPQEGADSSVVEGAIQRISRIFNLVEELKAAEEAGDFEAIARLVPERCSDKPESFPCSWGHKNGDVQYCEYYDHCWNPQHQGRAIAPLPKWEACPEEFVWSFDDEAEDGTATAIKIDSRKVPQGVDQAGFLQLVDIGALDYTKFLVDEAPEEGSALPASVQAELEAAEAEKTALNGTKNLFNEVGELNLGPPTPAEEAEEYIVDGKKAIHCTNCHKEVRYTKLGAGLTKKCTFCSHTNKVIKL